jgi:hypothetical protein
VDRKAVAAGASRIGRKHLPREAHGHPAKSFFRIGFERLTTLLRADPIRTLDAWKTIPQTPNAGRVV